MDDLADVVGKALKLPKVDFERHERENELPPGILGRVASVESGYRPSAWGPVTKTGERAMGMMQLMPETARRYGVRNPFDPEQSAAGAARYLRELLDQYGGDEAAAVAHYNGGTAAGRAVAAGALPAAAETRDYLRKLGVSPRGAFDDLDTVIGKALEVGVPASRPEPAMAPELAAPEPTPQQVQPSQQSQRGLLEQANTALEGGGQSLGTGRVMSGLIGGAKSLGTATLGAQQLIGKGITFAGDVADSSTLRDAGTWLDDDARAGVRRLEKQSAEYQKENPWSFLGGEVVGAVANPINKVIPGSGGATSVTKAVVQAAKQGATYTALTTPVTDTDKPFILEKLKQAFAGGVGGAAGGAIGYGLSFALNKGLEGAKRIQRGVTGWTSESADDLVAQTLKSQGIDPEAVRKAAPEMYEGIKVLVKDAMSAPSGKVDGRALQRLTQAQTLPVPVPMLKAQLTRDPMEYARLQNLSGQEGVGEKITAGLVDQNKALIANLDALGAKAGEDVVSAGKTAVNALRASDEAAAQKVTAAYKAFEAHTGKALQVNRVGLAQDYAHALEEFGDAIPGAVRKKFEGLGLMSGSPTKTFSIQEAERLIKTINSHYDPAVKGQANALNTLHRAVQRAITESTDTGLSVEAAQLAKAARAAAKQRFDLQDTTPGLRDAIRGVEPDKFIQKHVLQGNEAEIGRMMRTLRENDPAAAQSLADSVMRHIKGHVLDGRGEEGRVIKKLGEEDVPFSEAGLRRFLTDNNAARLTQVLGPERMATLRQLADVATNAKYAPTQSGINRSKTASAMANSVKAEIESGNINTALDVLSHMPFVGGMAQSMRAGRHAKKLSDMVNEATSSSLAARPAPRAWDFSKPWGVGGAEVATTPSRRGNRE